MSLVEQAARRLEQLRKAGKEIAGDLAYPAPAMREAKAEKPGTIERVARELEKHAPVPSEPTVGRLPEVAPSPSPHADLDRIALPQADNRREPLLKAPASAPPAQLRKPAAAPATDAGRGARTVELNFAHLAGRGFLTPDASQSRLANELRVLKRPLINNCLGKSAGRVKDANRIMITSALPGEGKSFLSANLAMSMATERDSTVLLVEADPTRPSLRHLFGIPSGPGLMDLLVNPQLSVSDVLFKTNVGRLSFISAGAPNEHATELMASATMEKLIEQLASRYPDRVLIFDSAPLLAAPEARVLARYMGQIVLVVEAEKTTHSTAQQALASLEACPVVMLALNKASAHQEMSYYYTG